MTSIQLSPIASVVTDARQPDNPIVAVNDAFLQLTGYEADEVIGRNCRFLAGPKTAPAAWAGAPKPMVAAAVRADVSRTLLRLGRKRDLHVLG